MYGVEMNHLHISTVSYHWWEGGVISHMQISTLGYHQWGMGAIPSENINTGLSLVEEGDAPSANLKSGLSMVGEGSWPISTSKHWVITGGGGIWHDKDTISAMKKWRYGARSFAQPFRSTVRIDTSKSGLWNLCEKRIRCQLSCLYWKTRVDSTQIMIQITVTNIRMVGIIILR